MTEKLYFCTKIHNKMRYILPYIRRYPLSCICIATIWVVCLMPIPEIPLKHVRFIDKWTHIALYLCTCGVIWTEYLRWHPLKNQPTTFSWKKILRWGWLAPIIMSGLIELAQAYCTGGNRSGEWLDFLANSTGATLMLGVGTLWVWFRAKG